MIELIKILPVWFFGGGRIFCENTLDNRQRIEILTRSMNERVRNRWKRIENVIGINVHNQYSSGCINCRKNGVDRIWIDLETLGKEERQKGMNTVKSKHSIEDIKKNKVSAIKVRFDGENKSLE